VKSSSDNGAWPGGTKPESSVTFKSRGGQEKPVSFRLPGFIIKSANRPYDLKGLGNQGAIHPREDKESNWEKKVSALAPFRNKGAMGNR